MAVKIPFLFVPHTAASVYFVLNGINVWNQTPLPVTDATGSWTLFDSNGNPVTGATNVAMELQSVAPVTPGLYQGALNPVAFNPVPGDGYVCQISFSSPTYGPRVFSYPAVVSAGPSVAT